eukprot:1816334-Rhodomonas_salina.1
MENRVGCVERKIGIFAGKSARPFAMAVRGLSRSATHRHRFHTIRVMILHVDARESTELGVALQGGTARLAV